MRSLALSATIFILSCLLMAIEDQHQFGSTSTFTTVMLYSEAEEDYFEGRELKRGGSSRSSSSRSKSSGKTKSTVRYYFANGNRNYNGSDCYDDELRYDIDGNEIACDDVSSEAGIIISVVVGIIICGCIGAFAWKNCKGKKANK